MPLKFRLYAIPAILYALISITALLQLLIVYISGKPSELAGVGIVILTLPWSIVEIAVLDSMHIYSEVVKIVLTLIEVLLNTSLLFFTFKFIAKYLKRSEQSFYEVIRKDVANKGDAPDQKSVR